MNTTVSFTIDANDRQELIKVSSILENMAHHLKPDDKEEAELPEVTPTPDTNHIPVDHNAGTGNSVGKTDPAATGDVELDKEGLPWDARIHSSSRKKTAKNVWKVARNKDPALVMSVKAELTKAMSVKAPEEAFDKIEQEAPTPEVAPAPPAPPMAAPTPPAPPAPPMAAPETETRYMLNGEQWDREQLIAGGWDEEGIATLETVEIEKPSTMNFPEFCQKVTAAQNAGEFEKSDVDLACQKHGLSNSALLASRPDLIPVVVNELFG